MKNKSFIKKLLVLLVVLITSIPQMWATGYNDETHVYLNVDGTTKYYKVSTESWTCSASLPGTWGGVLKDQTFSNIHTLEIKGGGVGGWTSYGDQLSGSLSYKVTQSTSTPSSWDSFGSITTGGNAYSGDNCFYYKNNGTTNVTPHTAGTYYLHIKISYNSTSKTSYVKFTIPSYTVAGSSAVLGTNWDQTDTDNDMVWSNGTTYTLTKSNVVLTKDNTYEYKVAYNYAWTTAYPASNASIDFGNTTGHYDVTFSFNASTHAVSATATRLYAVTYSGNSPTTGTAPATTYHANGATVTVASNSGSLAKTGYDFGGWNTNSSGTGTNYTAGSGTFTMGSADKPLYAKWNKKKFTVTVNNDGNGTTSPSGAQSNIAQVDGVAISATPDEGYEFTNWTIVSGSGTFTGGGTTSTSASTTFYPTSAATIRANFSSTATSTLTVTATAGGSITTPAAGYYSNISEDEYDIEASRTEGYKFTGWTKTAGDGAVSFSDASSLSTTATITTLGDVTVTAGFAAMSNSLSVSSSTLYAGDNITLSATRTNHSLNLTYQYKIGDGSWTDIATQSGTSKTWQIPYANTYQTYKFRVKSTDGSTSFYSAEQTVTVYGRITIHVKNTNSWATMKLYSWYNDGSDHATNGDWNGTTGTGSNGQSCSVHATGSQWWDVTITQTTSTAQKFILSCSTSGDQNKTADLNLSSFTHDAYYAMSTNGSSAQTLSSATTPAAPTVSTLTAGTIRETSAVLGGNIANAAALGNDIITERGYYWSTDKTLSSSNLGVGTKVTVSGTQSAAGNFSSTKSSLTAGTKYYFLAYAKNGYGTGYSSVQNFTTLSTYTVTVTAGDGGSASPSSVTAGQYQLSEIISASANTGYTFYNWTKTSGDGTVTFTNANAASTTLKSTNTATVRANFVDMWNVKGSWDSWAAYEPMTATGVSNTYSATKTLAAKTAYHIKVVKRVDNNGSNDKWYGVNGGTTVTRASGSVTGLEENGGETEYITFTTDAAGDYTITYLYNASVGSMKVTVGYPTAYTMTFAPKSFFIGASGETSTTGGTLTAKDQVNTTLVTGNKVKAGGSAIFTATKNSGYTFNGFFSNEACTTGYSAGAGVALSGDGNTILTLSSLSADKEVYAKFSENVTTVNLVASPTGKGTFTKEGAAVTSVSAGVTTKPTVTAVPGTGYRLTGTIWSKDNSNITLNTTTSSPVTVTGCGTASTSSTLTATFTPITYTIRFNGRGNTSGSMTNQTSIAYDASTNITTNAFVKTGYNFAGWATTAERAAAGTVDRADGAAHGNLSSTHGATVDLFAVWTPKQSALTFDYQSSATGYSADGDIEDVSATYDAEMPTLSGTLPTAANGYAFMGFYSATGGSGTKYYNADGTSANNWAEDTESGTTLYAYYKKAEITAVTLDNAVVESEGKVSFAVTVSPTPTGTTTLCFNILYANDNPLGDQPTVSYDDETKKYSFTAPAASATYKIAASLRTGSSCGGGTLLDSTTVDFQVAGLHSVTVLYKDTNNISIKESGTLEGINPLEWSDDITAPEIFGYTFLRWVALDGVTIKDHANDTSTTATIKIKAVYDGKLEAEYAPKQLIYFKNTLGWSDVYVNFYTASEWDNADNGSGSPKGCGNKGVTNRNKHMTRIGETDVWYYDYGAASITPTAYISFTDKSRDNVDEFWAENPGIGVVYPANYADAISTDKSSENGFKAATPMFVPLNIDPVVVNKNATGKANYNNAGYWTKYLPGTGYTLEIYEDKDDVPTLKSIEFISEDELMPMKAVVDLEANKTYRFQLRRGGKSSAGIYYGNTGTMTYDNHGAGTAWHLENTMAGGFKMAKITTNAAGDYTFNLSYSANASNEYRLRMAVDYPVALGDYRLLYKDNVHTAWHPSAVIPKANAKDTVSFFVRKGQSAQLKLQKCNGLTGEGSWTDTIANWWSSLPSAITQDSVYNICLKHNASTGKLEIENVEAYTGNYYIRTDAANSKWDNYRSDPDHLMTYSEYSEKNAGYSHYYCHWVEASSSRKNIKFTIANDYSPCISDTLTRETASGTWANIATYIDTYGNVLRDANVRFMWNRHDNTISRAYVDGAQGDNSENFLYMLNQEAGGVDKIRWADESALTSHKVTFLDNGNWIYEANIEAQAQAQIKVLSNWGTSSTVTQYFRGGESSTEYLISGSGTKWYPIRVLYDFKTNRLVAAWQPSGDIDDEIEINADVMFIREHQGDIDQLTFTGSGAIKKIETAYGVLRLNKWTINNKSKADGHAPLSPLKSRYERDLFYVSFPFRVSMEEVFGFGTYGQHWIIEYYDGASRAANGYWLESGPNWKFVTNRKNKFFEPGQGYIIALDLDELGESSSVWTNTDQVELYFPSYGTMPDITKDEATYNIPSYECTINWCEQYGLTDPNYDRRVKDSHWNVLGVPTYVNPDAPTFANTTWITAFGGPNFLYEWNKDDNTVTAVSSSGFDYHAMHAYLVQYCGNVTWTSSVSPATAPRRNPAYRGEYEFRLEMMQNDVAVDQAFVKLSDDETVTTGFEFNYDLIKEFNNGKANIYTLIGSEQVAGNVLPLTEQTTVIPVGVKTVTDGDYTFSMPDGTEGIGVTLIDNETGIRTSLSALTYTINLEAGTYNERFVLEISPISQVLTDIDNVQSDDVQGTKAHKIMIDGLLYIVKDGVMYDARGARAK